MRRNDGLPMAVALLLAIACVGIGSAQDERAPSAPHVPPPSVVDQAPSTLPSSAATWLDPSVGKVERLPGLPDEFLNWPGDAPPSSSPFAVRRAWWGEEVREDFAWPGGTQAVELAVFSEWPEPTIAEEILAQEDGSSSNDVSKILPDEPLKPLQGELPYRSELALRSGWAATAVDGDKTKIGEFQSLGPAPFWDFDGLVTDGERTLDFFGTGLDTDGNQAGLRYIGPGVSADVDYQRYLRRRDHDPLNGMVDFQQQQPGGNMIFKEDLNTGEDFAIRVQELKANFKGKLTSNIDWRLNIWGMRKKGERQVTAMGHCFSHPNDTDSAGNPIAGIACHVLTQRQRIDWLTTEIEPVLEGHFGPATVEYSRTMRTLSQGDDVTMRSFDNFGGFAVTGDLPIAVVPENYTEIDKLKVGAKLKPRLDFYSRLYTGNTLNRFRHTNRRFHGYDLRLTDWSIDGLSVTGYAKNYIQTNQKPQTLFAEESPADIRTPINYDLTTAGLKGRWRPFFDDNWGSRLSLSGGYEYRSLERENAVFAESAITVDQSHTISHLVNLRAAMRWRPELDSYVRYRLRFIEDPLFGVPTKNTAINTGLPTQEHLVEVGGSWSPTDRLLVSVSVGIENRWNTSNVANFQEDNYPIVFTTWYAPTAKWSFSGGLAFFSNWIDQDITLGSKSSPATSRWSYGGQSDVVNVGTTYAWSECLVLSGGLEFVRGKNTFAPPALFPDLPQFSDVIVQTTRLHAGLDYSIRDGVNWYLRYQYYDYEDESEAFNSGTVNMFLGGVSADF